MKRRLRNIIIMATVVLATAGLLFAFTKQVFPLGNGQTKFILVKDAEMMRSGILKRNAAILITDQELIKQDEGLFIGNRTFGHACGYHYDIQFWESSDKLIEEFPFNQECEEFANNDKAIQDKMKGYIKILETKPTHFIYNLKIPVATDPELVKKSFANSNLTIFFLQGMTEHFSSLTFTYMQVSKLKEMEDKSKWDGEQNDNKQLALNKMNFIVEEIKKVVSIKEQSKISFPMQGFGATIEHEAQITLKFSNGTDLTKVKEIIKNNGGEYDKEKNPDFYFVQLVDKSDNLDDIKKKIESYKFVTTAYEYPATK
jgi:hypothetical protein